MNRKPMEMSISGSGIYMLGTIVVRDYPAWPLLQNIFTRH
jgi:hypothetical protein